MRAPVLAQPAFHGIVGEIVETIAPTTEACPAAMLTSLLICAGSSAGRGPHYPVGATQHPGRLFGVIVGDTSRARKGQSWSEVRRIMVAADPGWEARILGGFGSGEAVVGAVSDDPDDSGRVQDRRLLVREGEFARILRVAAREGSTLSMLLRAAWDGDRLEARTRRETITATGGHVSVVADITAEELRRELSSVEIANGLGNRFLFAHAARAQLLPDGGGLEPDRVTALGRRLEQRLVGFRRLTRFSRTPAASERWAELYQRLADEEPVGIVAPLTARAEAQVLRLQLVYAGLDGTSTVEVHHVDAAEAVWNYSHATVEYVFAARTGNRTADRLLDALEEAGDDGLTFTEQGDLFDRHVSRSDLEAARALLEKQGSVVTVKQSEGAGRPTHRTFFVPPCERSERSERTREVAK